MELNSELQVRQEIMTRLKSVYVVLDGLIGVAGERRYNWREGQGYQLNITKNDFREIKINFESFYNLRLLLSKEQTTNYDNWQEMITMVYSLVRLFKESKILFLTSFETTSGEITRLRDRIKKYIIEHNLDPIKNSAQYKTVKDKLSLKQLCELALKENDIYLEDDLDDLDFTGKKEFILYTFVSAKYEVAVNGINKEFAEFIKMNPDKIPHLDDMGWMLETMRNDDVITQDQFDEFEAYYEDVISLVDDVQELKIITSNNKPLTIKESELMTTPFEITTVGGVIDSRLEGMDYYYLVLTGAPSYHYGLLLLEEEISNEDIIKNLTLIQLEGYSVGFRYRNKEDYWDKGEQIKQKYLSATLLPAEEINGKQFKALFK
jgi:hypothetical protein